MYRNYLLAALRSLKNNKVFSLINTLGLAIGLAVCLLITLYVLDETGFDTFNTHADRIYRVDSDIKFGGNHFVMATVPEPMGAALKRDFPEVEQVVRFRNYGGFLVKKGSENLQEDRVVYTDSTLFSVFTLPMIAGNAATALVDPGSVVITETIAKKYFNTTDVVGKVLVVNNNTNLTITGVIKDVPKQSHFNFDFFVTLSHAVQSWELNNWVSNNLNTYVLLKKGADPAKMEARMPVLVEKYIGPQAAAMMKIDLNEFRKSGNHIEYSLMPLTAIHLHSNKSSELGANSSVQYVYIFSTIAVFILLIACVNFMNLSTARSANRAKEVGVRKVIGALRKSLITQFLTESILTVFISLILSLVIAWFILPAFNELSGKQLSIGLLSNPLLLPAMLVITLVVGLLAGSYPAFFLSAFQPIKVLKGKLAAGFRTGWLRSTLVVFQFTISVFLIVGTVVIYKQLNYIRNKNIGYSREQMLVLQNTNVLGSQVKAFKEDILKMSGVQNVTITGFLPTSGWRTDYPLFTTAVADQKNAASMQVWDVDENYIPTLGMQMVQGRNFSQQFPTDSQGIIINESAARLLGFRDAVNKDLYAMDGDFPSTVLTKLHVLGVVKDFNFNSLREQVTPLALRWRGQKSSIAVRVAVKNAPGLIGQIESKWKAMVPGQPFHYSFMDEDFNHQYNSEQRTGSIFIAFASLAIFIACLGLLGLVMFTAEQRTKEIGIRKVLGANVVGIVTLLSRDFLKLVCLSILIASPLAWWAMNKWLQDFAYRTSINWTVFAITAAAALLVALFTISFQAIRAANANPVKSLKSE